MIDQFGYRPGDPKVAVIANPSIGYNSDDSFEPGKVFEVRRSNDDRTVFSGPVAAFDDGKVQELSGDSGFWFDFSKVAAPGSYYLYDATNRVRSHTFEIREDIYRDVLGAAVRMFFYNRSGFTKAPPYADRRWSDGKAYTGPGQDGEARAVTAKSDASTARDLSGGWFDAGDTNKYVNNAGRTLHQLLAAYRERPKVWSDALNIPESGNGIPDLIDEIKWEVDWLQRMQRDDGGVLVKLGTIDWKKVSPPSRDRRPRYYAPVCSSSTISAAGVYAHAAVIFAGIEQLRDEADVLEKRARSAWQWYHNNEKQDDCDTREVKSGNADRSLSSQAAEAVVAAIYLFARTGEDRFSDYVLENHRKLHPFRQRGWSHYASHNGEALLYFVTLPGVDDGFREKIRQLKLDDATSNRSKALYADGLTHDLYRAYMNSSAYHWGSNGVAANLANSNLDVITYGLAGSDAARYRARALGMLHYLHGVNPQGMVYLSNMKAYGAEVSISEMYHTWFDYGTPWHSTKHSRFGPAPGFLVGGANARYSGPLSPPAGQPPQKSFSDRNRGNWREKIWEVSEPHIPYQSAYVKLLSKLVPEVRK